MSTNGGWIGVDFDGTLAYYNHGDFPALGAPIPRMVARVKAWLAAGIEVRIVTARVSFAQALRDNLDGLGDRMIEVAEQTRLIREWCELHIGQSLEATAEKDFGMMELWDDRAVSVDHNTGRAVRFHGDTHRVEILGELIFQPPYPTPE